MARSRFLSVLAASVLISACGSIVRHDLIRLVPGQQRVPPDSHVLVLKIPDGSGRSDGPAHGSGAALAAAMRDSLLAHGFPPQVSGSDDLERGFVEASVANIAFVLKVVPTEWEDNATKWSGKPDSAALSIELYSVASKTLVGAGTYSLSSTKNADENPSPNRFIPEFADNGLAPLFGWSSRPRGIY